MLCLLGHLDTVLADPADWAHDPWSGELADGFLWGRGALDMKDQVAAEAVAGAARARAGWRPQRGALKLAVRGRRGDRRRGRGILAVRRASRSGPLRHAAQRGRRSGVRVRRPAAVRCRLRGEGGLPVQSRRVRRGWSRLDPAARRQRAAEAGAGARGAGRPTAQLHAHRGARRAAVGARARPRRHRPLARRDRRSIAGVAAADRADVRNHADADDGIRDHAR